MHTGVVRPKGVNMGNRWLIGAEMKGCQVRGGISSIIGPSRVQLVVGTLTTYH